MIKWSTRDGAIMYCSSRTTKQPSHLEQSESTERLEAPNTIESLYSYSPLRIQRKKSDLADMTPDSEDDEDYDVLIKLEDIQEIKEYPGTSKKTTKLCIVPKTLSSSSPRPSDHKPIILATKSAGARGILVEALVRLLDDWRTGRGRAVRRSESTG